MRGLTASVEEAESELTVVGYKLVVSKERLPKMQRCAVTRVIIQEG